MLASATDPAIRLARSFPAGEAVEGDYFTSEGRYTLIGYGRLVHRCAALAADDEAQVLVTLRPGGCTLAVSWHGSVLSPGHPAHGKEVPLGFGP